MPGMTLLQLNEALGARAPESNVLDIAVGEHWIGNRPFNLTKEAVRNGLPSCPSFTRSIDQARRFQRNLLPHYRLCDIMESVPDEDVGHCAVSLWVPGVVGEQPFYRHADYRTKATTLPLAILRITLVTASAERS